MKILDKTLKNMLEKVDIFYGFLSYNILFIMYIIKVKLSNFVTWLFKN